MFVVERRAYFLMIETKGMDEPLTQGQRIMLSELSCQPRWTVVIVYGEKGQPKFLRRVQKGVFLEVEETSREDFQQRIDNWYHKANRERSDKAFSQVGVPT